MKWLLGLLLVPIFAVAACGLLPEEYAVNAPIRQLLFGHTPGSAPPEVFAGRVRVPDGFSLGIYAEGLQNPRWLRFSEAGDLLVSTPRSGEVWLLDRDADGDGRADGQRPLLSGLNRPHGLELRDGWLWIGETDAVARIRFDADSRSVSGGVERIIRGIPGGENHWSRTIRFGPDGGLYVSVGSSCNVCIEPDPRRAAILRYEPDGSGEAIHARGLRNAVGFDWQPGSGDLYATDNGRDLLGDDFPPCELNRVVQGGDYGWPHANGDRVPDPDFGPGEAARIAASIPPAHSFAAHNAPLGIHFLRGDAFPPAYRGAAFVALHGSWNRTTKDGYKVVSLHWDDAGRIEERDFLTGLLRDDDVIGRPVDVAEGPDGALYVSDDFAGAVYRIAWQEGGSPSLAADREEPASGPERFAADPEAAARGRALYDQYPCASCHEPGRGEPGVVVSPLTNLAARYDAESLADFLATPTPPMPAFPLSPDERRDLAHHLLSRDALPAQSR